MRHCTRLQMGNVKLPASSSQPNSFERTFGRTCCHPIRFVARGALSAPIPWATKNASSKRSSEQASTQRSSSPGQILPLKQKVTSRRTVADSLALTASALKPSCDVAYASLLRSSFYQPGKISSKAEDSMFTFSTMCKRSSPCQTKWARKKAFKCRRKGPCLTLWS